MEDEGAVGWTARAEAVAAYRGRSSQQKAQPLRSMLDNDFQPTLLA
ncbi:MAG TPA: hypothetical protein VEZ12_16460 [Herpetosiphonaceae bacterium]|nr:hypothetical protein [Herpetosiphonaceae bacterium]